jgi:hypothetical protein
MNASVLALIGQASQQGPSASDVVGAVWLGLTILGILSIIVVGFTTKKINNISNPTYAKAFVAQLLIGPLSLAALALFGIYLQAPPVVAFALAYSFIPIALYKVVFACMWREAALIWVVVTVVMAGASYLLFLLGLLSFATPAAA